MKSPFKKIILYAAAGWLVIGGFLFFGCHLSFQLLLIYMLLAVLLTCGLILLVRKQDQLLNLVNQALETLEAGVYKHQLGLKRYDVYGKMAASIDQISSKLMQDESVIQNIEVESEILMDRMRDTQTIQEHYQKLFDNPNFGIYLCDFEGQIRDVNPAGCRLLGYKKEELLTYSFYNLYDPDELTRTIDAKKIGAGQQAIRYESRFLHKNGNAIDVEISSNIYDYKNEIIQNIVADISARKQAQSELKKSEEKFRSFMESANDLMFITDTSGKIIYANQAMITALGMEEEILHTKRLSDLNDTEIIDQDSEENKEETDVENEVVWLSKSGQKIYGELVTSAVVNDKNEFIGQQGVFRDITERKKISKSRRLAQLGRLMADVAHEVKNRLMAIMSIAEFILLDSDENSEIAQDMKLVHEECRTMDDFVRQMLNFSRPSAGAHVETDIHSVLDSVLKLIAKSMKRSQIQVQTNYDRSIPSVRIDEKQISEVFMNIIQNAQEAMQKGGTIEIHTHKIDDGIHIDVKDDGTGIPEEIMHKIFDPFFTTKETGTGLGVSACYGIVKAHGGELSYSSEVGQGTTAHIALPTATTSPMVSVPLEEMHK
jgi:two-component system sporulation sensor kinase A